MLCETHTVSAAALVRRLISARAAYDAAARAGAVDFTEADGELEDALDAFSAYRCRGAVDLAEYAAALWHHIDAERTEVDEYGENYAGPLAEFWPIASAVGREFRRLTIGSAAR